MASVLVGSDFLDLVLSRTFDFDGDGQPEIALVFRSTHDPFVAWTHGAVWTFAHGAVARYAPAESVDVVDAKDIDSDGRLDLLSPGAYVGPTPRCETGGVVAGPAFAWHSLAGGGFSRDDAAAAASLARECKKLSAPLTLAPDARPEDLAARRLRARAWNAPPRKWTRPRPSLSVGARLPRTRRRRSDERAPALRKMERARAAARPRAARAVTRDELSE